MVDDNRDGALTLARMLKLLGNEVRTAHDGIQTVGKAEEFRPDVIFMDVGMPGLNGYEATRRIRKEAWGRSAIVIALTGWGQEGDRIQSREAGATGISSSPLTSRISRRCSMS
jgi:CheY-like chemotaxis protein